MDAIRSGATVAIDSRKVEEGGIFVGLNGQNTKGSRFLQQALDAGAAYCIVEEILYELKKEDADKVVLVADSLSYLQSISTVYRRSLALKVLAITGSNGKTTTKELVRDVLSMKYIVRATLGNYNNHIGVPLTLLSCRPSDQILVCEMGANHQGEIDFLCHLAEPDIGLITNIGKAHLEGFGGVEGVQKGKSEMYRYLTSNEGVIIVDEDQRMLTDVVPEEARVWSYRSSEVKVKDSSEDWLKYSKSEFEIQTKLVGKVNRYNIASALAIGEYLNIEEEVAHRAISNYIPTNNRSQLEHYKEGLIVFDCYNSNPSSLQNTLNHFLNTYAEDQLIFVLGDMLELGDESEPEHRHIISMLATKTKCLVILIGEEFVKVALEKPHLKYYNNTNQAKEMFAELDTKDKIIVLKGSRGVRVEEIVS